MNPINPTTMAMCVVLPGFFPNPRSMRNTAVAPIPMTIEPTTRTVISAL